MSFRHTSSEEHYDKTQKLEYRSHWASVYLAGDNVDILFLLDE